MMVSTDGKLISHAYQSPGIHLVNMTWCEEEGQGSHIYEHIDITAPKLLLKIVYQGAAVAHRQMFTRLKQLAEQEAAEHTPQP